MGLGGFVDDVLGMAPEVSDVAGLDALEPLRAFQDMISGVEQVEVTDPDGTKRLISRRIPLSAEAQAQQQQISEGITGLLQQAQELSDIQVAAQSERFKPIVDAQTEALQTQLAETVQDASLRQEESLAKRGLSSSTAGIQGRTALAGEEAKAQVGIASQGLQLGEQLRQSSLQGTLAALQPFQQQQTQQLGLEQAGLNRGTGLQLSLAQQELQRMGLNQQVAMHNSTQRFEQSKIASETANSMLSGGLSAAQDAGSLAAMGTSLAAFFSDRRLKKNIRLLKTHKGVEFYTYEYKGSDAPQVGVMAQEVEKFIPNSTIVHPSGYLMVDYTKVMEHING